MATEIVFLTWDTKKSGGNMRNFAFADILAKKGYSVKIFSFCKPRLKWRFLKVVKIFPFWQILSNFGKPNILIATFWPTAYLALVLPAKEKVYFVSNWEADFHRFPLLRFLAEASLKLPFNKIITISRFLEKRIRETVKRRRIYLIPYPIDFNIFKPRGSRQLGSKKRILSVVSSYSLFKGMDDLVRVVKALKKRNPSYSCTLVSFEKRPYSPCFDRFLSDPPLKQLVAEYQRADVYLNTSLTEGFCLPPLEAMASGCPVVITDSGGVREYAKKGRNCLLAKNVEEIIKKRMIERVLTEPILRKKIVRSGLKTAKKFSWEKSIEALEKYLNE